MATAIAMTFEEALARIHPGFGLAQEPDLDDDFIDYPDQPEPWAPHSAAACGFGAPESAEGDYFEGQDAHYEAACRVARSLVR